MPTESEGVDVGRVVEEARGQCNKALIAAHGEDIVNVMEENPRQSSDSRQVWWNSDHSRCNGILFPISEASFRLQRYEFYSVGIDFRDMDMMKC